MDLHLKHIIGIDQTGTKNPLPLALLTQVKSREKKAKYKLSLHALPAFTPQGFQSLTIPINTSETWITADCVFWALQGTGLPGLWKTFEHAKLHRMKSQGMGRAVAESFFQAVRDQNGWKNEYPARNIEVLTKANSVFRVFPYQKNIQTGTFRIWSEISGKRWLNIWPFEKKQNLKRAWLAEGYPTWMWKNVFASPTRKPEHLARFLKLKFSNQVSWSKSDEALFTQSPDYADAVVLAAATLAILQETNFNPSIPKMNKQNEGWIFGVKG